MNVRAKKQWIAGGALGAMLLGSVAMASAATADEVTHGEEDVQIEVAVTPVGALTLNVANPSVTLGESTSPEIWAAGNREFTGVLDGVSVSDDRNDVADGAGWAVTGQVSDFTAAGLPDITHDHLGWVPELANPVPGDFNVSPGLPVAGELQEVPDEPGPGGSWLEGGIQVGDLLVSAGDSAEANGQSFGVKAGLNLTVPKNTPSGAYASTLTLTLMEG
ncbi:hypothetical protein H9623_06820 [Oerskovia sp. Sa1BUA8]|uniref:WxL domain-containing protein n=1 Tax=Oerskovia douganii TaxID=2762210 RepID=A0A9D5U904_9CELL|nr:hypothetical protein [Oerskovia douganii]MBE7700019.1 hypothetical protein [Oerskovia douganii]